MGKRQTEKGARAEEILRRYFLKQGFFVVRGLKFRHGSIDITDVDLWLYQRPSPLTRERVIVDARDRARPQAVERILWARGLWNLTGVERCVVATTDRRKEIKEFASRGGVLVLDGGVLLRLIGQFSPADERLTEEDFALKVFPSGDEKLLGDWRRRVDDSKARLLDGLSFDGCNAWLEDVRYFLEAARSGLRRRDAALRLVYLTLAFLLVGLDWVTRITLHLRSEFTEPHNLRVVSGLDQKDRRDLRICSGHPSHFSFSSFLTCEVWLLRCVIVL